VRGPLEGVKIIELGGIGPVPYGSMVLAEAGASVLRIARHDQPPGPPADFSVRSRPTIGVDLKAPAGVALVLDLVEQADALVEGFRPGVAERMGLGPEACQARNPRLVYGRMTGWGQEGPWAQAAGHDINYIATAGALWPIGPAGAPPEPPLNLVGDFGGGGMLLAFGVAAGLLQAERSGRGPVVDAAMVDGVASQLTLLFAMRAMGVWQDERGGNLLDSGAPFYGVYEAKDGGYVAVGAIEPKFYAELLAGLGLSGEELPRQMDRAAWPAMRERFAAVFATRTRDQWSETFAGTDACVTAVLAPAEAPGHPHVAARQTYVDVDGAVQPNAAPRFDGAAGAVRPGHALGGEEADRAVEAFGVPAATVAARRSAGAFGPPG
jgi:alpha-methylacyl-CoA racemase